ncbi:MAG TPA: hypothetical protein VGP73_14300 [Thermoanaerobaculia bacterium]
MSSGLFGSTALEIAIGLSFIYLLLALLCTTVNEWLATLTQRREKLLKEGIQQLLDNQPVGQTTFLDIFYEHPLIKGLMRGDKHPAYLPARTFAAVVLDYLKQKNPSSVPAGVAAAAPAASEAATATATTGATANATQNTANLLSWVDNALEEGDVRKALRALVPPEGGDFSTLQKNVEGWFDDVMDRVSGWHKRRTQLWTVIVALVITVGANADTLKIIHRLSVDPALRQAAVDAAKTRNSQHQPAVAPNDPKDPINQAEEKLLLQVIGWGDKDREYVAEHFPTSLCGWFLSIVAISLGAPFWFDVLNKFINVRSAGKSPDEGPKAPEKKQLPPADKVA